MSAQLFSGKALQNKIIRDVGELPAMPQIVHKAREVIENPDSNIEDFSNLIIADQVLALKVLKIAQKLKLNWNNVESDETGLPKVGYGGTESVERFNQDDVDGLLSSLGL